MNTENEKSVELEDEVPTKKKSYPDKREIEEKLRAIKAMRLAFG